MEQQLIEACQNGRLDEVRSLINTNVNLNAKDNGGCTALMHAAYQGHQDCVKLLIDAGADLDIQESGGGTALINAAYHGHQDCVKLLIDARADLDIQESNDWTALIYAAYHGHQDCVKLLIDARADLNIQSNHGKTAETWANERGHTEIVRMMREAKKGRELIIFSKQGHLENVEKLLNDGVDINYADSEGQTALHHAAKGEHLQIIKSLITRKANMNVKDQEGRTALDLPSTEEVKLFLMETISSALFNTVAAGNSSEVKNIVDSYPTSIVSEVFEIRRGPYKNSVLLEAVSRNHLDIVTLLLDAQADIEAADEFQHTALLLACRLSFPDIVNLLIARGANVFATNVKGDDALTLTTDPVIREILTPLMRPPRFSSPECLELRMTVGQEITRDSSSSLTLSLIQATDPDWGAVQEMTVEGLPASVTMDPHTGELSGVVAFDSELRQYDCSLVAKNSIGSDRKAFTVRVRALGGRAEDCIGSEMAGVVEEQLRRKNRGEVGSATLLTENILQLLLQHVSTPSIRASVTNALEALRSYTFNFYGLYKKDKEGSYDGMVFRDLINRQSQDSSSTSELKTVLHLLSCLAWCQGSRGEVHKENVKHFLDQAAVELASAQNLLVKETAGSLSVWVISLYLLTLARLTSSRDSFDSSQEEVSLRIELLQGFVALIKNSGEASSADGTEGWLTTQELKVLTPESSLRQSELQRITAEQPPPPPLTASSHTAAGAAALSRSEQEWQDIVAQSGTEGRRVSGEADTVGRIKPVMTELLSMVGLESVKQKALQVFRKVTRDLQLPASMRVKNTLNFSFMGNPGTGKTTVARIFGKLLHQLGARASDTFVELKAHQLLSVGDEAFAELVHFMLTPADAAPLLQANNNSVGTLPLPQKKAITMLKKALKGQQSLSTQAGGVIFIDEAHMLDPARNPAGRGILNILMGVAEDHRDSITVILAGYRNEMEQNLYANDVGLKSRFSDVLFADYDFSELRQIWLKLLESYSDPDSGKRWVCDSLTTDIAVRRVARDINRHGFGNGRDLRNAFETAANAALSRTDFDTEAPALLVEDVIGPPPNPDNLPELRAALNDLYELEGLEEIKATVQQLLEQTKKNYRLEVRGEKTLEVSKNRIFWGNPGTGKTTCAQIYGRILKALRLLSDGEVVVKSASDFVGSAVGESENKTRAVIELCRGKVLLIDECYNLDDNMFGKKVLDTLVEKVSGQSSEDIAVLLVGYEQPIRTMLRNQNPGLASRFNPAAAFNFVDYSGQSLLNIMRHKAQVRGLLISPVVLHAAVQKLKKMKQNSSRFGNAREVDNLLSIAQTRANGRLGAEPTGESGKLRIELEDISPAAEDEKAEKEAMSTLDSLYNISKIRQSLKSLQVEIEMANREGRAKPKVGNFQFLGNSGTGKTTVARVMAQLLSAPPLQLLSRNHVHMTKGTELKGAFIGKAQENVRAAMEAAQGGLLFIDEAYSLGDSQYGKEALEELLTLADNNPQFSSTVVILAGYEENMDAMLNKNQGLKSRFRRVWKFDDWSPEDCAGFCCKQAEKDGIILDVEGPAYRELLSGFERLMFYTGVDPSTQQVVKKCRPGWANARDADNVYKDMLSARDHRVYEQGGIERIPQFHCSDACSAIEGLLRHRPAGESVGAFIRAHPTAMQFQTDMDYSEAPEPLQVPSVNIDTSVIETKENEESTEMDVDTEVDQKETKTVQEEQSEWEALSAAEQTRVQQEIQEYWQQQEEKVQREAAEAEERRRAEELKELELQRQLEEIERRLQEELAEARREAEEGERRRVLLALEQARQQRERAAEEAKRLQQQEMERLRVQQRLRVLGLCPASYEWIKCRGGYKCAGGSHFVSDAEVNYVG